MSLLVKGGDVSGEIATHAALATVHQDAPALIDADVATHAALATVHQDAPALIDTDVAAHDALTTGVHGSGASYLALHPQEGIEVARLVWLAASTRPVSDLNRTTALSFTDLDLTTDTSAVAVFALMGIVANTDSYSSGSNVVHLRRNGDTPTFAPTVHFSTVVGPEGRGDLSPIVAMDSGQVIEYEILLSGTGQYDTFINLLGYTE
ncbi:hypothetical protein LCGC14_2180760 [marine sediment metagenome]|uniref:Uncharacterized protein n=1 Tax=marine sediment metagenome TaxID=412755 RepID=A0A0F9DMD5_9ZZZZ